EGDFPIGITGARIPHDQLSYRLFAGDELILAVPKGHPLAKRKRIKAKELAGQKMILREKGSGTRLVAEERLRAAGMDMNAVRVAAELGDPQGVRTALKAGVGISIVSRHAVEEDLLRGDLKEVKIEGFNCARSFYSVVHKGRSLTPLCRTFLEFIHAEN
ncbi:MAG: LysR substrate-binding domain-containing protein, partial [bacterium]|nr:LysR substrate-binding domain-containing protein [bacterium]